MLSPVFQNWLREPVPKRFICEELDPETGLKCNAAFTRQFNLKRHRMDKHRNSNTSLELREFGVAGTDGSLSTSTGLVSTMALY